MPKRTLRQLMLAQRRALSHEQWLTRSFPAQQNLLGLEEYRQAYCVAIYAPVHNEVDTSFALETAFNDDKKVLYPVVRGQEMVFRQLVAGDDLVRGRFGIPVPGIVSVDHSAEEADIIVVPGVAFDLNGHRIGYGKGYYDRFLHNPEIKACFVGLCYDFQLIVDLIPIDHHDIRMDIIITESRIIRC